MYNSNKNLGYIFVVNSYLIQIYYEKSNPNYIASPNSTGTIPQ